MADHTTTPVPPAASEPAMPQRISVSASPPSGSTAAPGWQKDSRPGPAYYKVGGRYRYDLADLDNWAEAQKTKQWTEKLEEIIHTASGFKRLGECTVEDFDFIIERNKREIARLQNGVS